MGREITPESILDMLDKILESPPKNLHKASSRLKKFDRNIERLLDAAKIDENRRKALLGCVAPFRASYSALARSLGNAKRGGKMCSDWMRLAQRDFSVLKDDLLALREQIVGEADFLKFACLREQIGEIGGTDPKKLFEELHEAGAISERTWLLLMTRPGSWRDALKDREISKQLSQISSWLLDLQETRRKRVLVEKKGRDANDYFQEEV